MQLQKVDEFLLRYGMSYKTILISDSCETKETIAFIYRSMKEVSQENL
jgi:hypothetical protein